MTMYVVLPYQPRSYNQSIIQNLSEGTWSFRMLLRANIFFVSNIILSLIRCRITAHTLVPQYTSWTLLHVSYLTYGDRI